MSLATAARATRTGGELSTLTYADFMREAVPQSGLTMIDFFCGAGGSSQGAMAAGVTPNLAANHWRRALDSHAANHPDTDHYQGDIHEADVTQFPRADIFWASPECPKWSSARGEKRTYHLQQQTLGDAEIDAVEREKWGPLPKEADERSRALMWDVQKYLEAMIMRGKPVLAGVVENVVECRAWVAWDDWLDDFRKLGYEVRVIAINSMHAESRITPRAPQSRDRLYVAYWHRSLGRSPNWDKWLRPSAWCDTCDEWVRATMVFKKQGADMGRYGKHGQYVYRCPRVSCRNQVVEPGVMPALAALDLSIPAQRIGDRAAALSPKTMDRIVAGLRRYSRELRTGETVCPPMLVPSGGTWREHATSTLRPMPARTTTENDGFAVPPLLVPVEGREGVRARPATGPMRTQTARSETGLLVPLRRNGVARLIDDAPLPTFAAGGQHHALVMRNYTPRGGPDSGQMVTPATEYLRTLTASGKQSVIEFADAHRLFPYDGNALRELTRPLPAQTTVVGDALLGIEINPDDCTFRMMEPHEAGAGMAFVDGYIVTGNRREMFRQYGNAVTPPVAEVIVCALREAITGEELERHVAA